MRRRHDRRGPVSTDEQIRPEVRREVHRKPSKGASREGDKSLSRVNKVFWVVMVFFFISAGAYYLDVLINGVA